jgi:hypothetical protein
MEEVGVGANAVIEKRLQISPHAQIIKYTNIKHSADNSNVRTHPCAPPKEGNFDK